MNPGPAKLKCLSFFDMKHGFVLHVFDDHARLIYWSGPLTNSELAEQVALLVGCGWEYVE